jgi:hypothetical protein
MKTLLLGDVCPHTSSYDKFKNKEIDRIFGDVLPIFEGRDFIAVNLECALTETDGKIKKFGPALAAPIETAEVLKSVGVNLCGLSNNHIFDLGTGGIRDTLAALSAAGLDFTGFGKDETDARKNYFFEHDLMYNSSYHPNDEGAARRTSLLTADIRAYLTFINNNPTGTYSAPML